MSRFEQYDRHVGNATGSDEESPLIGPKQTGLLARLRNHMTVNIDKNWGDLILLSCYVVTGLLDSSSIFIWRAFVSMQTGNTIYLGLGLVAPSESDRWEKSVISIVAFCFGSFCFGSFHRVFSPAKRWVLFTSFLAQMLCIVVAGTLITLGKVKQEGLNWHAIVPLALLSFQSSGQTVTSRALECGGLTSVVLTSNYCDLFSDPDFFVGITKNTGRNRRGAAILLLLLGAASGGLFAHSSIGLQGAVWTAAALKLIIVLTWLVWPAELAELAEPVESDDE